MLTVTLANFFAVLFAFIGKITKKEKVALLFAVIFLIIFYGLRGDYGNDPPHYHEDFDKITDNLSFEGIRDSEMRFEPGWLILNLIFKPFGWQALLFSLTVIQFGSICWFILKYSDKKQYYILLFLYLFNPNLMLICLSMLRQALAMSIWIFAIQYLIQKRYIKFVILILLASSFHSSALILLSMLVLPLINKLDNNKIAFCFITLFFILKIAESLVGEVLEVVLSLESFDKYSVYTDNKEESSLGLYVFFLLGVYLWLFLRKDLSSNMRYILAISSLMVVLNPFSQIIPLVSRIGLYFMLPAICIFPLLLRSSQLISKFAFMVYVLFQVKMYFAFFYNPIWHDYFYVYTTCLD